MATWGILLNRARDESGPRCLLLQQQQEWEGGGGGGDQVWSSFMSETVSNHFRTDKTPPPLLELIVVGDRSDSELSHRPRVDVQTLQS